MDAANTTSYSAKSGLSMFSPLEGTGVYTSKPAHFSRGLVQDGFGLTFILYNLNIVNKLPRIFMSRVKVFTSASGLLFCFSVQTTPLVDID